MRICIKEHERNSIIKENDKFKREFQVDVEVQANPNTHTAEAKHLKKNSKINAMYQI